MKEKLDVFLNELLNKGEIIKLPPIYLSGISLKENQSLIFEISLLFYDVDSSLPETASSTNFFVLKNYLKKYNRRFFEMLLNLAQYLSKNLSIPDVSFSIDLNSYFEVENSLIFDMYDQEFLTVKNKFLLNLLWYTQKQAQNLQLISKIVDEDEITVIFPETGDRKIKVYFKKSSGKVFLNDEEFKFFVNYCDKTIKNHNIDFQLNPFNEVTEVNKINETHEADKNIETEAIKEEIKKEIDQQKALVNFDSENDKLLASFREEVLQKISEDQKKANTKSLASTKQYIPENNACSIEEHRSALENAKSYTQKIEGYIWGKYQNQLENKKIIDLKTPDFTQISGQVYNYEAILVSNNTRYLLKFVLADDSGAINCTLFLEPKDLQKVEPYLTDSSLYFAVQAEISLDTRYTHDLNAAVKALTKIERPQSREDKAVDKRIELHCHSQMSQQDAIASVQDIIKTAHRFGHKAVAITDHGVVQAFPDAYNMAKKLSTPEQEFKLIFGMEGYMIDDGPTVVYGNRPFPKLKNFVAFDVETTGLDSSVDRIIEIGACRFVRQEDGTYRAADTFQCFVNPKIKLTPKIVELTNITDDILQQEGIDSLEAVRKFADFVGDDFLCAHNCLFDLGFLRYEAYRVEHPDDVKVKFNHPIVDTLSLAKYKYPNLPNHKLNTVCAYLDIDLHNHHRALDDAMACGYILSKSLAEDKNLDLEGLNRKFGQMSESDLMLRKNKPNHIIFLAKDLLGLYSIYRLVSESHVRYFNFRPRLPKSLISYYKAGMIVSSACVDGQVYKELIKTYCENNYDYKKTAACFKNEKFKEMMRFYDYVEIQPRSNNSFLWRVKRKQEDGTLVQVLQNEAQVLELNKLMLNLANKYKKTICATCDAHYLEKKDDIYRKIIQSSMGFENDDYNEELYFRTTEEMLAEFSYLGSDIARQVVIENPQKIAGQIQYGLRPFPSGSFPPFIEEAADIISKLTWDKANELYAHNGVLPEVVEKRIEKELNSIINNGFAVMYYIAHKLVKKSNEDGYIVGSRGSVGSSLVATLCGITEVNPLQAHYRCPICNYTEFMPIGLYGSGFDLPQKYCPYCQQNGKEIVLECDGQDIPFETFLGFNGDKQPDIDLNFSGEYQARAHAYIEEMFGHDYTFRAGTIGAYAEKNALAIVNKYLEKTDKHLNIASKNHLARSLVGVKKTTGQHPGGIVVIPKDRDVYEFTPVQYPANKLDSPMTTTHFDFNMIHDTILKLDILGHDVPTILRFLYVNTGIEIKNIPITDKEVMRLFYTTEPLGISDEDSIAKSATLGLPEMGTFMARDMIKEAKPRKFFDLVQLMGLSHGTDVWKGNAQDLIRNEICSIDTVIGCRDSIMTTLIYKGLPSKDAFDIMEKVRKGKGLSPEHEALMLKYNVEDWYIESCKKIKYMFPKAHAVAYLISALRIAWFKINYPAAYYAASFSVKLDEFDSSIICCDMNLLKANKTALREAFTASGAKEKDKKLYYLAELAEEMYQRNIFFSNISILESEAVSFKVENEKSIRPPLAAVPGISSAIAYDIVEARKEGPFKSKAELAARANLGNAVLESMNEAGLLNNLPDDNQVDLFSLF